MFGTVLQISDNVRHSQRLIRRRWLATLWWLWIDSSCPPAARTITVTVRVVYVQRYLSVSRGDIVGAAKFKLKRGPFLANGAVGQTHADRHGRPIYINRPINKVIWRNNQQTNSNSVAQRFFWKDRFAASSSHVGAISKSFNCPSHYGLSTSVAVAGQQLSVLTLDSQNDRYMARAFDARLSLAIRAALKQASSPVVDFSSRKLTDTRNLTKTNPTAGSRIPPTNRLSQTSTSFPHSGVPPLMLTSIYRCSPHLVPHVKLHI